MTRHIVFLGEQVPAGMIKKGPRGMNQTITVYEELVAEVIKPAQFAVPAGIKCTPGEVQSLSEWTMTMW